MQRKPITLLVAAFMLAAPSGFALADSYSGAFSFTRDGVTITGTITEDGEVIITSDGELTEEQEELLADLEEAAAEGRVARETARADVEEATGVDTTDLEDLRAEREAYAADNDISSSDSWDEAQESLAEARDSAESSLDDARETVEAAVNDARDAVSERFN
jgi:hypothetical protein